MKTLQTFLKIVFILFIGYIFFISCKQNTAQETVLEEVIIDTNKELTLEEKIEGTWSLMSYHIYRIRGNDTILKDFPKIELQSPIETSYIRFPSYGDIEFKTPRGRSLYRDWRLKDTIIYAGCSNNIPKDCNFGNTHALLRGAFKVSYIDSTQLKLICTSNFEPGSKTIEEVLLIRK